MSAQILDGKELAAKIKSELKTQVEELKSSTGDVPRFINIIIGNDPGSCSYAKSQQKIAEHIGIDYQFANYDSSIPQDKLIEEIQRFNNDTTVHGIMIHKPVPQHINYRSVANYVSIDKDLEGINVGNIGRLVLGETKIIPCTPASVMEHIQSTGADLRGKEVVVVGHSDIVGQPLTLLLLREYATVTVCHIGTSEAGLLPEHVGRADVLVVAVGRAGLIKGEWIKPGAIVIDVGINRVDGKIVGDVEFETAKGKASYITPVPGGVGPVTVVMLMKNGVETYKQQLTK